MNRGSQAVAICIFFQIECQILRIYCLNMLLVYRPIFSFKYSILLLLVTSLLLRNFFVYTPDEMTTFCWGAIKTFAKPDKLEDNYITKCRITGNDGPASQSQAVDQYQSLNG